MTNKQKIIIIKSVHTIIYFVMVAAIFYIVYSGVTKNHDICLNISLFLLAVEIIVFFGNGRVCPFTNMAKKYGDEKGYVGDIFLPKKVADMTFYLFGTIFLFGLLLLVLNFLGLR